MVKQIGHILIIKMRIIRDIIITIIIILLIIIIIILIIIIRKYVSCSGNLGRHRSRTPLTCHRRLSDNAQA